MWEKKRELYELLVARCPNIELKGKKMLYTSDNGYMYSTLTKDAEFGIRFSKEVQEKYIKEWKSDYLKSHGAIMKGYVKVPESFWTDMDLLANYLNESQAYVMSLDPK